MNTNLTTALTEKTNFLLPTMVEGDFTQDELSGDMDGVQLSFPRIKIPGGGVQQFEIPTDNPEDPTYVKTLECVILHHHRNNAYWPEDAKHDENTSPLCSSTNGKVGIGTPGGVCATCGMNQYGTATKGMGKACKNMRTLYLLRSGDFMPLQLTLSPTSLKPFDIFCRQAFLMRRRASFGSVVQIGLKKMNNNGKDDYSVATFRRLYDFEGEQLAQIRVYANSFKAQVQLMLDLRAAAKEEQHVDVCEYPGGEPVVSNAAGAFQFGQAFGQTINGDLQVLPA